MDRRTHSSWSAASDLYKCQRHLRIRQVSPLETLIGSLRIGLKGNNWEGFFMQQTSGCPTDDEGGTSGNFDKEALAE